MWSTTGTEKAQLNYVTESVSATDSTLTKPSSAYPAVVLSNNVNSPTMTVLWIRTRAYPPNGVMPTVAFSEPISTSNLMLYIIIIVVAIVVALYGIFLGLAIAHRRKFSKPFRDM